MATKTISDTRHPVKVATWLFGKEVSSSTIIRGDSSTGTAVFHRPRPPWPDCTGYLFRSQQLSTEIVDNRVNSGFGLSGKIGTPEFVYSDRVPTVKTEMESGMAGLTRALAKQTGSGATLGESLAESKQTFDMISKRARQLGNFALAIKRGDMARAASVLGIGIPKNAKALLKGPYHRRAANAYLETMYGWAPVVQEISNVAKLYADGLTDRGIEVGSRSGNPTGQAKEGFGRPDASLDDLPSRGGYRGVITNPMAYNANAMGLLNPLQTGYNLIGLSFVFDWLVPLGAYLGALTGTAGLSQVSSWRVAMTRTTRTLSTPKGSFMYEVAYSGERIPTIALPSLDVLRHASAMRAGQFVSLAALFAQRLR